MVDHRFEMAGKEQFGLCETIEVFRDGSQLTVDNSFEMAGKEQFGFVQ